MKISKKTALGGDESHAYTFGRLDAALGEHPMRFVNGPEDLRAAYLEGFNLTVPKLATTCTINGEFKNEFPWHKSNGSIEEIHAKARAAK